MKPLPILLSRDDGSIVGSNPAAQALLGRCDGTTCKDLIKAEDAKGTPICAVCDPTRLQPGEQRDHGLVRVRGWAFRLICSAVDGTRVQTLLPAPTPTLAGPELSEREREVLVLVARGLTSRRIAVRLGVSIATVRTHVEHIRDKLGVRTRSQAVARALALGQIE